MSESRKCKDEILKEIQGISGVKGIRGKQLKIFRRLGNLYVNFFCTKMKERVQC